MSPARFATAPAVVVAFLGSGLLTAAFALTLDPAGRLLLGVAAAVLLGEGLRSALLRPTLVASADGVSVVHGLSRRHYPWDEVVTVDVLGGGRPRRRAQALELDLGRTVVLVAAYRLGRPLTEVVSAVAAQRPSGN